MKRPERSAGESARDRSSRPAQPTDWQRQLGYKGEDDTANDADSRDGIQRPVVPGDPQLTGNGDASGEDAGPSSVFPSESTPRSEMGTCFFLSTHAGPRQTAS